MSKNHFAIEYYILPVKKTLSLLLFAPLTLLSLPESHYRDMFAKEHNGEVEVSLPDRTRADIITDTHAIEVEFAPKWKEAIGQSLNYAFQSNKKAGIVLIVETRTDERYLLMLNSLILHYELPIEVWTIKAPPLSQSS